MLYQKKWYTRRNSLHNESGSGGYRDILEKIEINPNKLTRAFYELLAPTKEAVYNNNLAQLNEAVYNIKLAPIIETKNLAPSKEAVYKKKLAPTMEAMEEDM